MAAMRVASNVVTRQPYFNETLNTKWFNMNPVSANSLIQYARRLYSMPAIMRKECGKDVALLKRQRQIENGKIVTVTKRRSTSIVAREISGKNLDFRKV